MHIRRSLSLGLLVLLAACSRACIDEPSPGPAPGGAATAPTGGTFEIPSGIQGVPAIRVEVLAKGDGPQPKDRQRVVTHYVGTLLDGRKFDSSRDQGKPFSFILGAGMVIAGWDIVVAQMHVGDRWKATIPWQLAYGERGAGGEIGPRTNLVFDMELIAIK